ncbi:hypothetical protein [uncultured Microbacterium sp.]|uniref:hypothetical protein n=1 Tax=uncultured Microbacterium sp. TaxID=191216 RepID=UPI0025EC91E8|nr:hypothetical protein [uncultured Microbacterium sp.]
MAVVDPLDDEDKGHPGERPVLSNRVRRIPDAHLLPPLLPRPSISLSGACAGRPVAPEPIAYGEVSPQGQIPRGESSAHRRRAFALRVSSSGEDECMGDETERDEKYWNEEGFERLRRVLGEKFDAAKHAGEALYIGRDFESSRFVGYVAQESDSPENAESTSTEEEDPGQLT